MKVSIITATIDGEKSLGYTIGSVQAQTYPDIEHVVVDGNSTDRTAEIVRSYEGVRLLLRDRMGVYNALNFGIRNTTGDIFGFVHGNDALASPDVISRVVEAFEADPELDFVFGDLRYVSPRNHKPGRIYHAEDFSTEQLIGGVCPPHPTLYIRRTTADRIGEYAENYRIGADFDMWIRLFCAEPPLKYRHLPLIMVNMTTGGLSTKWRSRLYTNNIEKLRALRANGKPANPLRLFLKYFKVARDSIKDFFVHGR